MTSPTLFSTPAAYAHQNLTLGSHVHACRQARGRGFALRCIGERVHDLIAPRFCTTILGATALIALLAFWI